MNKEDLIIGVHGSRDIVGGHYNVLASFTAGLIKGFEKKGVKAFTTKECFDQGLTPNMTIGFNVSGYNTWQQYMDHGIKNIMWTVDPIFAQNFEALNKFSQHPNFVLFSVTPCDQKPLAEYFPNVANTFLPHATDLDLWKKPEGKNVEKDLDIVLFSSIQDYEQQIEELKASIPESLFKLMMDMYNFSLENPNLAFWDVYQLFKKHTNLSLNVEQYVFMFKNISSIALFAKKAQAVQKLSKFNLKIFGDGPWEKYVSGNVEYLKSRNIMESIEIINRAKIVLHPHSMQLSLGLHERLLNASALETFVLSADVATIKNAFEGAMGFYNNSDFSDIEEKTQYFLEHEEERIEKAKAARKIVEENHTWDVRAEQILDMVGFN